MQSDAHAEHRAVYSHHHGRHAATPPEERKRLTFWATLHCLAHCDVGKVLALVIGRVFQWGHLETIAPTVSIALGFAFEPAAAWRGNRWLKARWQPIPRRSGSWEPISNCRRLSQLQCRNQMLFHSSTCLAGARAGDRPPSRQARIAKRSQRAIEKNSSLDYPLSEVFRKRVAFRECLVPDCACQRQPPAGRSNQKRALDIPSVVAPINAVGATSAQQYQLSTAVEKGKKCPTLKA